MKTNKKIVRVEHDQREFGQTLTNFRHKWENKKRTRLKNYFAWDRSNIRETEDQSKMKRRSSLKSMKTEEWENNDMNKLELQNNSVTDHETRKEGRLEKRRPERSRSGEKYDGNDCRPVIVLAICCRWSFEVVKFYETFYVFWFIFNGSIVRIPMLTSHH